MKNPICPICENELQQSKKILASECALHVEKFTNGKLILMDMP
jgi:hypothetical protein